MRVLRSLSAVAVATAATAALLAGSTGTASAADGTIGVRETVCAQDLYVRTAPGGAWMGTLYYGQTFLVESKSGDWVYGFAYGNINRHGWAQDGWFC
jgi:hypothetical protein